MAAIIIPVSADWERVLVLGGGWAGAGGAGGGAGERRAGLRNTAEIMATGPVRGS